MKFRYRAPACRRRSRQCRTSARGNAADHMLNFRSRSDRIRERHGVTYFARARAGWLAEMDSLMVPTKACLGLRVSLKRVAPMAEVTKWHESGVCHDRLPRA